MQALWQGQVVADAADDETVRIEGNVYFPPSAVTWALFSESPTAYTCPWKGAAQYYSLRTEAGELADAAWAYPDLRPGAVDRIGRDFAGYVAFDPKVEVRP